MACLVEGGDQPERGRFEGYAKIGGECRRRPSAIVSAQARPWAAIPSAASDKALAGSPARSVRCLARISSLAGWFSGGMAGRPLSCRESGRATAGSIYRMNVPSDRLVE